MKNEYIQQRIEPTMHVFSIGFPFVTAFVGLFLGVYAEPEVRLEIVAVGFISAMRYPEISIVFIIHRLASVVGSIDGQNFVDMDRMEPERSVNRH